MSDDWRSALLAAVPLQTEGAPVDRLGWPGYAGRPAVRWGRGWVAGHEVVAAVWDFAVYGGSFGEQDAAAFVAAAAAAAAARRPLVSFVRSGGTRLQEGVGGLVGLARATLAARRLAAAGVPHLAVCDQPTTGGAWVTVGSRADLRAAVVGSVIGFGGPRVVEVVTGIAVPAGSHTAESAYAAGLVDALLAPAEVEAWLAAALHGLAGVAAGSPGGAAPAPAGGDAHERPGAGPAGGWPERSGWEQVVAARTAPRSAGRELVRVLVPAGVPLRTSDDTVAARVGRLAAAPGTPVVAVALAADRGGRPGPAGFLLLARAAELAGRLHLPLVTLVDTPGAEPGPAAEAAGQAPAIGTAMAAVLGCRSPTVAVVTGEGGSGGALAAACGDVVLVGPDAYLTALSPEGAAVTLRVDPAEAADRGGLRPADLLALGFADGRVPAPDDPAFAAAVGAAVADQLARPAGRRLADRERRWSGPLGGYIA